MSEVTIIGIDLAKRVFQVHRQRNDGSVVFRKKLSRGPVLAFFAQQLKCGFAVEACATAHGWPEIIRLSMMLSVRFPLSLRNVEELLHERGVEISHDTVRCW